MISFQKFYFTVFLSVVLYNTALCKPEKLADNGLKLRIIHTNDMHSRFEQASQLSGKCSQDDAENGRCYGGFPRLVTAVRQVQADAASKGYESILLNAGDTYQGTLWYTVYKWQIVAHFVNLLGFDAISLGNHEFDDGVEGLVPFLKNSTSPVLIANADITDEPDLRGLLSPSFVIVRNSTKIGVIGYLTPETPSLANTGKITFSDEVSAIDAEAARLKAEGVNIIIAVGHSGYEEDQEIAASCPDVDVVVGGHSHTFLYTGTPLPDNDEPAGPYPTIVQQQTRSVPVVQAYAYTKYLGVLDVDFDSNGDVIAVNGSPLLLDSSIEQDPDVLNDLNSWADGLGNVTQEVVGVSRVFLDGGFLSCRRHECNFGNLVTDALIDYSIRNTAGQTWTLASIALISSGIIRADIIPQQPAGTIRGEDVIVALPFYNPLTIISLPGQYLLQALEWSVYRYDNIDGFGEFLQISGIRVTYDVSKEPGARVVNVEVLCSKCSIPIYEPLDTSTTYNIVVNKFMAEGGDNYTMIADHGKVVQQLDGLDTDVVIDFIKRQGIIYPGIEGRIKFQLPIF